MRSDVVLPAPFGPEVPEDVARLDGQVDVVDGDDASVALEEAAGRDGRRAVHFKPFAAAWAVAAGIEPAST